MSKRNTMSKAAKAEGYDAMKADRDRLLLATHDILNGAIVWSGWHKEADGSGRYRAGVSRLQILYITFRHPGQSDYTSIYDLDRELGNLRYLRNGSPTWEPVLLACIEARRLAFDAEQEARNVA